MLLADVAELADAQASGACGLTLVEVRLLSSAFLFFGISCLFFPEFAPIETPLGSQFLKKHLKSPYLAGK